MATKAASTPTATGEQNKKAPALYDVCLLYTSGGLSDAFAEGHVEAPSVYFRVSPHFSEECGGLSFKADTIHELHPPHLRPRE